MRNKLTYLFFLLIFSTHLVSAEEAIAQKPVFDEEAFWQEQEPLSFNDNILAFVDGQGILKSEFLAIYKINKSLFERSLGFDLSLSRDRDKAISKTRTKIRDFLFKSYSLDSRNLHSDSLWLDYKLDNFVDQTAFSHFLQVHSISEGYMRTKFEDNLLMSEYFNLEIASRILDDLINDYIALEEAQERNIEVSGFEISKKYKELVEIFGGDRNLELFLQNHDVNRQGFLNEIARGAMIDRFKERLFKEDYHAADLDARLYYKNHLESDYTLAKHVFFARAFVPSEKEELVLKIKASLAKPDLEQLLLDNSIIFESMIEPAYYQQNLYSEEIQKILFAESSKENSIQSLETDKGLVLLKRGKLIESKEIAYEDLAESIKEKIAVLKAPEFYEAWVKRARKKHEIRYNEALIANLLPSYKLTESAQVELVETPAEIAKSTENVELAFDKEATNPASVYDSIVDEKQDLLVGDEVAKLEQIVDDVMASDNTEDMAALLEVLGGLVSDDHSEMMGELKVVQEPKLEAEQELPEQNLPKEIREPQEEELLAEKPLETKVLEPESIELAELIPQQEVLVVESLADLEKVFNQSIEAPAVLQASPEIVPEPKVEAAVIPEPVTEKIVVEAPIETLVEKVELVQELSAEEKVQEKLEILRALIPDELADLRYLPKRVVINANRGSFTNTKGRLAELEEEQSRLERVLDRIEKFGLL